VSLADLQPRSSPRLDPGREGPFAVVDIGSNSVRLVIYEGLKRSANALYNEKTICAIGRNMVRTGQLDGEGIALALEALARFRRLSEGYGIRQCEAVATAAARDAQNGKAFIRRAEAALGCTIEILSGEDEARIAAEGVLAGIPDADGLTADLGGGSLDMVTVRDGHIGDAATLPFGPLRLMDTADDNLNKARNIVDKALERLPLMNGLKGRALYAVGGIWRTLARVDMDEQKYPLHVLHHYAIPSARALKLCKVISGLSRKSLEKMPSVPKRRADALPYGALVMERMIQTANLSEVVISAYGLREGVHYRHLPPEEAAKDPLIEYAFEYNARESRNPALANELTAWTASLFPRESASERRVREALCLLGDIAWRRHPDDRAAGAFMQVLRGPYAGATHRERAVLATGLHYRYSGMDEFPEETAIAKLLGPEGAVQALRLGLAARLAFALVGSVEGELPSMPLHLSSQAVSLTVPARARALLGENVTKRLNDLSEAFGRKGEISIV
jgi:exopolyphosphatase/guanosine-5'-triphosphate,3'-diphosphate pyrophosphatase